MLPATNNFGKFAETIDLLMCNLKERLRLGNLSRKYAEENHSVEKIIEKLLNVIGCNC